jgi:hypothetical protein
MDAFCIILYIGQSSNKTIVDHNRILTKNFMFKGLFMKSKLLAASLLSVLAVPAFAATPASDPQSVTVTVPEVALLDVKDATGGNTITITAPTVAGEGFTATATLPVTYALSSNVAALPAGGASTARRKISANLDADLPENWQLSAEMAAAGGTSSSEGKISFTGTTAIDLLTAIGNERTTADQAITYTLEPVPTSNGMMAYVTNHPITVTYTLSGDS